jgi:hypothetical protein
MVFPHNLEIIAFATLPGLRFLQPRVSYHTAKNWKNLMEFISELRDGEMIAGYYPKFHSKSNGCKYDSHNETVFFARVS